MKKALATFALAAVLGIHAKADVLANYPFTGSSRASTDSDLNSVATNFNDGPGLISTFDVVRGNPAPSIAVDSTQTNGTSQATAVTANDYYTFTITPVAGFALNLSSLAFDYANYTNDGTFPTENFFARSSVDGFANNLAAAVQAGTASAGAFANTSISLGAPFQNLTSTVEFRIYLLDSTTDADRGALLDNIVLNGTTAAVPEPSMWAMVGIGTVLLAGTNRLLRRKTS